MKALKDHGHSSEQASAKVGKELLVKPKEYQVRFRFPSPPPINPPVLGAHEVIFAYQNREPLLINSILVLI